MMTGSPAEALRKANATIAAIVQKSARLTPAEIITLREAVGVSQSDFARAMGVTVETMNRWERGRLNLTLTSERFIRLMAWTFALRRTDGGWMTNAGSGGTL